MITLNREYVISEALHALLLQSYPRELLQIVIVDGGSTDRTVEICRNMLLGMGFADYDIIIKPSTIPEARNICIDRMRGEYLFFWDSDIIMHPRALEELIDSAYRNNIDILSAKVHFVRVKEFREGWQILNILQENAKGGPETVPAVTMSATLIRRRVFEKLRFDPDLTLYEDLDFCVRARSLGFQVMEHKGVIAVDLNPIWQSSSDIFTSKPIKILAKGLKKKARAKSLSLSLTPGLRAYLRYILSYKRWAYYLSYTVAIPIIIIGILSGQLPLTIVTGTYILSYLVLQILRRGLKHGIKVFILSFLIGLPLALLMLYYSFQAKKYLNLK